ncbi:CNT_collapsed_G0015160.mRNA.1.CDS.1 [Saccharomyces cerevisiae]|nr:CNT_collapsed_G0015160.mRNA.1.CDS.1 [Saccharomyces cerevisiae]
MAVLEENLRIVGRFTTTRICTIGYWKIKTLNGIECGFTHFLCLPIKSVGSLVQRSWFLVLKFLDQMNLNEDSGLNGSIDGTLLFHALLQ